MRKNEHHMPKTIAENDLATIEEVVRRHPEGIKLREIIDALAADLPRRTLQYRLKQLVDTGRVTQQGERRWTKYFPPQSEERRTDPTDEQTEPTEQIVVPVSPQGEQIRAYLRKPPENRTPVGYNRDFLDFYRPNDDENAYLTASERAHLAEIGQPRIAQQPAGTYVKHILNRLLIDLSWNSSRLEGNTYSLLDTRRLIEFGKEAEGRERLETQMILNHKDAIEFLAGESGNISFNRYTILNLHAMLANNLLEDEAAAGRLRHIAVGIEGSPFHPLEVPPLIEECFDQVLMTAEAIRDPFEQAFFVMVHLPYLQPFDDVNKRVSRLAANIPFIKGNLTPISFMDVPSSIYTEAMLGIYELNKVDLLKDLFVWAYERSAARYAAARQSLGEPDPFRLKYRVQLRELISRIVREQMGRQRAFELITVWAGERIDAADREEFQELAEKDLLSLHEGNFARYQIRPAQYEAWQNAWNTN
ncbi:Fic family protein [Nisaea sp.]|uniref:Fic family protein n=1 Tax=Nisaea sp. TaxID=2024842 RepID=UPI0032EDB8FA